LFYKAILCELSYLFSCFILFSIISKSVQKYYKEHQPKRCETLNRTLTHVNKLLSFSEGKDYKEGLKEKKALKN
ncbi:hypothetical protein, partial [Aliivibrio fischeri]|uniref:hypothetical protein n=1 Tax=Aliivibrio fischeri TaxID=668 RepID=UPI001C038DE3